MVQATGMLKCELQVNNKHVKYVEEFIFNDFFIICICFFKAGPQASVFELNCLLVVNLFTSLWTYRFIMTHEWLLPFEGETLKWWNWYFFHPYNLLC